MKIKVFYLGLLSTFVMATAQTEGLQRRVVQAPQAEAKLKQHEQIATQVAPHLDVGTHGDPVTAVGDISAKIGTDAHPSGTTANHKIADLNAKLGGANSSHQRVDVILDGLGALAAHPNHTVIERIADLHNLQGAVTNDATAPGARSGHVGPNGEDLAGSAIKNEERILARLKAGVLANAGVDVVGVAVTPAGTAAAAPRAVADRNGVAAATNIQDLLSHLGW